MERHPDGPDESGPRPVYTSRRFHRGSSGSRAAVVGLAVVVVAILGVLGWWLWQTFGPEPEAPVSAEAPVPGAPAGQPSGAPEARPSDLPDLDGSDGLVRGLVEGLSSHPRVAAWLVTDDLVRRFVVAVVRVANGGSPGSRVDFLAPDGSFTGLESEGRTLLDPASYGRYDLVTEAFTSLDTQGGAELYRRLHPLFEDAYRELGLRDRTFDDQLARAVRLLLSVQVPEDPPELVPNEAIYEFADPDLEGLTSAEKHLIRMGPDNARRIQVKLRALAEAVGLGV